MPLDLELLRADIDRNKARGLFGGYARETWGLSVSDLFSIIGE
jgi:hypothetical protein